MVVGTVGLYMQGRLLNKLSCEKYYMVYLSVGDWSLDQAAYM